MLIERRHFAYIPFSGKGGWKKANEDFDYRLEQILLKVNEAYDFMIDVVSKLKDFCHYLRHDGITYGVYIEQLTYLLSLKMVKEKDIALPEGCGWNDLIQNSGSY